MHLADGFGDDAGQGAAPSSVDGGDDAFFGIDDQDRGAVGGADAQEKVGLVGCEGVAFAWFEGGCLDGADYVGVDLVERDQGQVGGAQSGLEAAFIFFHAFALVPFDGAEVQGFFVGGFTNAAGTGAEAVDQPREVVEGRGLKDG